MTHVNTREVRENVQSVYRKVAAEPGGDFHFERGPALAAKLGYPKHALDRLPEEAMASFAGVGFPFGMIDLSDGDTVLDLGSGSGMDAFYAARQVGPNGQVIGLDMTREQLAKAELLRDRHGFENVSFVRGYIEDLPLDDASVDVVVSNGVINLSTDKPQVFREIARVLTPGGRMAVSDIVTEQALSNDIVGNASLWAACIGGAAQQDHYRSMIEAAGLRVVGVTDHPEYRFLSGSAQSASQQYGVKSVSIRAEKSR